MHTYYSAAERPEPPHEKQGQKEEQRQQGDQKDGAIKLETERRHSYQHTQQQLQQQDKSRGNKHT